MAASSSQAILEGWLRKEASAGQWKKRYAILSSRKLELFKDETKTSLLGNIHIRDAEIKLENKAEDLFLFSIKTTKEKTYMLATQSLEDSKKWVETMSSLVALKRKDSVASSLASPPDSARSMEPSPRIPSPNMKPSSPPNSINSISSTTSTTNNINININNNNNNHANNTPPQARSPTTSAAAAADVPPPVATSATPSPTPSSTEFFNTAPRLNKPPTVTMINIQLEKGVLKVHRHYEGAKEGASVIEWLRSDDGGKEFHHIMGAKGIEYKPTADDLECDLKVRYVPRDVLGDTGPACYSENFKLKLEPSFFNHLKNIFLQGYAVFTVKEGEDAAGSNIVILLNRRKIKIRRGKTIAKTVYNQELSIRLDPNDPKLFTVELNSKKKNHFRFCAPSAVGRDGIALTIRLFNSLGCREISRHILGDDGRKLWMNASSANDAIIALRDRLTSPIPVDAPQGVLVLRKAIEKLLIACENGNT